MRKYFFSIVSLVFIFSAIKGQRVAPNWCGVKNPSSLGDKSYNVDFNASNTRLNQQTGKIIIPVVFHIVYNNSGENISSNFVQSQIDRLNLDFNKLNSDVINVPSPWQPITADFQIEFKLACIDPNGQSTSGITRTFTNRTVFDPYDDVKRSVTGGVDAWPTDTYLNIWVCNLVPDLLGFSTFPSQYQASPNLDGVILSYQVVGDNNSHPNKNKGRVATHEIGHWLGLYHMDGTDIMCGLDIDLVPDTPTTASYSNGFSGLCPSGVFNDLCNPLFPGAMYMNYMQLTNDPCMYMFTNGQKARARSFIEAPGPDSRWPFLDNYFGIIDFSTSPVIPSGGLITINLKNPACLPTQLLSLSGAATLVNITSQQVVLQVNNCLWGTISLSVGSGNYVDDYTFAFSNNISCPAEAWPKVYIGDKYTQLDLGPNNSLYWGLQLKSILPNLNHTGAFPAITNNSASIFHYNKLSGLTDWVRGNAELSFVHSTNELQFLPDNGGGNYNYINGTNGQLSTPFNIPAHHKVLVEISPSLFVTRHWDFAQQSGFICIVKSDGTIYDCIPNNKLLKGVKFNPVTQKIFLMQNDEVNIYDLSNSNFSIPPTTVLLNYLDRVVQITNQDKIYIVNNGSLKEISNAGTYGPPISISGLTNDNIVAFYMDAGASMNGPYVSDDCLVGRSADERLYAIHLDPATPTQRNISTANFLDPANYSWAGMSTDYVIDGGKVYIAGSIMNIVHNSVTFGNLQINSFGVGDFSNYLTKFDQNIDFGSRNSSGSQDKNINRNLSITISPNPAQSTVRVNIAHPTIDRKAGLCGLTFFDQANNIVLRKLKYVPNQQIDISSLKSGVYYIEVVTSDGVRTGRPFIKL